MMIWDEITISAVRGGSKTVHRPSTVSGYDPKFTFSTWNTLRV